MKRIGFISDDLDVEEPISRAISEFGDSQEFRVETLNRLNPSLPIIQKIRSLLEMCDVVVFYISQGSPNIYYEIGLAQGSRKKIVIIAKSQSLVPFDLAHEKCIVAKSNNFDGIQYELYEAIFSSPTNYRHANSPYRSDEHFYDEYFRDFSSEMDFRDLYAVNGPARSRAFERWFVSLAKNVTQWDVIEAESRSRSRSSGFDFLLWNKSDDPEFQVLGNPIPVEIKALNALNLSQIMSLAERLQKQGLKSLLLLTTAKNRSSSSAISHRLKKDFGATIVALDRDDLLDVHTPKDLYFAIKRQLLEVAYRGD